jgi:predicted  nucleic acid-binding Zn-ribbon protein
LYQNDEDKRIKIYLFFNLKIDVNKMTKKFPYHKDKQQAFQAAQQGFEEAKDIYENLDSTSANYGQQLKRLEKEIKEVQQQIENAHEVAGEIQRQKLEQYQSEINKMNQLFD